LNNKIFCYNPQIITKFTAHRPAVFQMTATPARLTILCWSHVD